MSRNKPSDGPSAQKYQPRIPTHDLTPLRLSALLGDCRSFWLAQTEAKKLTSSVLWMTAIFILTYLGVEKFSWNAGLA
jgi:hypothetical protein